LSPCTREHVAYKRELISGDVVIIRSRVLEVSEKVLRFSHEMTNAESGEVAATTELVAVHIDRSVRKSCPFPPAVLERARTLVATKG